MTFVLDASALLAYLHGEEGADRVRLVLPNAVISSVNWSEVLQRLLKRDVQTQILQDALVDIGMTIAPFDLDDARATAALEPLTRKQGLSLGDRSCLALGLKLQATVLTADRIWSKLPAIGSLAITLIR